MSELEDVACPHFDFRTRGTVASSLVLLLVVAAATAADGRFEAPSAVESVAADADAAGPSNLRTRVMEPSGLTVTLNRPAAEVEAESREEAEAAGAEDGTKSMEVRVARRLAVCRQHKRYEGSNTATRA